MVRSVFDANHGTPRLTAYAISASCDHRRSGPYPCTAATGSSSAESTGTSPRSRSAVISPSPPTASTFEPAGTWSAISRATACAEVITSAAPAGTPSRVRCSATVSGVREALLVT